MRVFPAGENFAPCGSHPSLLFKLSRQRIARFPVRIRVLAKHSTCFQKASCAFATSDSSPTADAPRSCRFAFICSARRRRQSNTYQAAKTQVIFGSAQNVVDRCRSSRGLLLPRSNFVLLPPRHCCRMKRLSTTRNFCVPQHAQSLCALPFYKPRLSIFSSLLFARVMRFRHLFIFRCRLSCSAAQLGRISTPHLPPIEFA